jgi:hypothetical protein
MRTIPSSGASSPVNGSTLKRSHGLIATTLVARKGRMLTLTTEECACVLRPDGRRIAGENNTGSLTRWTNSFMEQRRSEGPTS